MIQYKGFTIQEVEKVFKHGVVVRGHGIFIGDKLLAVAHGVDLAKHVINVKLRCGAWVVEKKKSTETAISTDGAA